jgi:hypothetical protein
MPPKEISRYGCRLDEGGVQSWQKLPHGACRGQPRHDAGIYENPAGPPSPAGFFRARVDVDGVSPA